MTTDEAKNKWCPMMPSKDRENVCISSNCMLWRWHYKLVPGEGYEKTNQGGCGLAAAPRNSED